MQTLIRPVITEKAILANALGKYIFEIQSDANKAQVASAVSEMYKVEVIRVNIIHKRSEEKLIRGRFKGKTKAVKKAVVTLKKGQKIPGFEEK